MARRKTPQTRTVTAVTTDTGTCYVEGSVGDIVDAVTDAVQSGFDRASGKTEAKIERVNAKVDRHYHATNTKIGVVKGQYKTLADRVTMLEREARSRPSCEHTVDHVVKHAR